MFKAISLDYVFLEINSQKDITKFRENIYFRYCKNIGFLEKLMKLHNSFESVYDTRKSPIKPKI